MSSSVIRCKENVKIIPDIWICLPFIPVPTFYKYGQKRTAPLLKKTYQCSNPQSWERGEAMTFCKGSSMLKWLKHSSAIYIFKGVFTYFCPIQLPSVPEPRSHRASCHAWKPIHCESNASTARMGTGSERVLLGNRVEQSLHSAFSSHSLFLSVLSSVLCNHPSVESDYCLLLM